MRTDCWLPLMKRVGGMSLVMMSSQAVYRAGLVAPLLGSGRVITTSSDERELARSISVRRRCLQILLSVRELHKHTQTNTQVHKYTY